MWIDEKMNLLKDISSYISKHSFFNLFYIKIKTNYATQFTIWGALLCFVWYWNIMDKPGDIVNIFYSLL